MTAAVAVDEILDVTRKRADEIEQIRRLPDDVVAVLRRSGIHRLLVPAALGGAQASVLDTMDVIERLAACDGSTAWCAVIGVGSNAFAGYLPEAGARRVFADPDRPSATMFAPQGAVTGDGRRHVLNGRWPFASNCLHSGWIGLGALLHGDDGTADRVPRVVFVRVADLTVEDSWESSGLRGTGSHHVVATDVPVEPDQWCTFADRPWAEGTLWRLPIYTVFLPLLAAAPLGIARGALDEVGRQAREGRTARRGQVADDPVAMADFAAADARLRGARAALREGVAEARDLAERSAEVGRNLQARIYLDSVYASEVAVAVTAVAHQLGGGAAAYAGNPLLRALNDVHAARQHLLFSRGHLSDLGRAVAGIEVHHPPFLP